MFDATVEYTWTELLIITAGREIKDGEVVFVGTFWPLPASVFAKRAHAKGCTLVFEGGLVCERAPLRIPLVASDPCLVGSACMAGDVFDTLGAALHAGRVDVALVSSSSVDRFGNINTTCVGPYQRPQVRLAGSGGACDLGSLARRLVIVLEHDKRRFPQRAGYITTPGFLDGGSSREEAGLPPGTGPRAVITTLGVFGFDSDSREIVLQGIHKGVRVEDVRGNVQWPLKVSEDLQEIPPPTQEELRILREEVDPHGMFLRDARLG